MRALAYLFVVTSGWGQIAEGPPTVRDAYVVIGNPRVASLTDHIIVVVCKSDYDTWRNGQRSSPVMSLYMNGLIMKGPEAVRPMPVMDRVNDSKIEEVKTTCAKEANDAVVAGEKQVGDDNNAEPKSGVKQTVDPRYVMQYYLDPQFVARPDTKEPWMQLLENPWQSDVVTVSVGLVNGPPWPSEATIRFERIHWIWLLCWAVLFVPAIIVFIKYARKSDIIRDRGKLEAGVPKDKAYSLARTQMAVWTFLVVGMLVFIFLVTWNGALSSGTLVLLGISFSTTLLAATAERTPKPRKTQGFLRDLLSDRDGLGLSFHRCQMVLFTIVLAIIFVLKAASTLVMPEFDPTLLALMGISSGTYLGSKIQDQDK
jgi:hypothetical protein